MNQPKVARRALALVLGAALLGATFGCAAAKPPVRVQEAIRTINRQLPAYVAEANRALASTDHPDKERLIGMGERLARAVAALERWAGAEEKPVSATETPKPAEPSK